MRPGGDEGREFHPPKRATTLPVRFAGFPEDRSIDVAARASRRRAHAPPAEERPSEFSTSRPRDDGYVLMQETDIVRGSDGSVREGVTRNRYVPLGDLPPRVPRASRHDSRPGASSRISEEPVLTRSRSRSRNRSARASSVSSVEELRRPPSPPPLPPSGDYREVVQDMYPPYNPDDYYPPPPAMHQATSREKSREKSRATFGRIQERRSNSRRLSTYVDTDDYSDETDLDDQIYNIMVPGRSSSIFSQDTNTLVGSEPSDQIDDKPLVSTNSTIIPKPEVAYNVFKSQYSGEGYVGGDHKTDLTVTEEIKKTRSALFRWVHFRDPSMNLENFENGILGIPGLDSTERAAISKLFSKVRKDFDRVFETPQRVEIRVMRSGSLPQEVTRPSSTQQRQSRPYSAIWLCLPYFSLEKYTSDFSKLGKGAHPTRTLLQIHAASSDWKRESRQAVRSLPGIGRDHCYHVPQVWYLMLGDSLLVTCAQFSMPLLRGKAITANNTPMAVSQRAESKRLTIYYGTSVFWSFALSDCQNWFSLATKFAEFWPAQFRFLWRGKVVTSDLWPRIVNNAKHTGQNVALTLQISGGERPALRGKLHDRDDMFGMDNDGDLTTSKVMLHEDPDALDVPSTLTNSPEAVKSAINSTVSDEFFVFTWLSIRNASAVKMPAINQDRMQHDLDAVHTFLADETTGDERVAYKRSPLSFWGPVYFSLRKEASSMSKTSNQAEDRHERKKRFKHELCVDVFNAAESLFEFFLPLSYEGPTVSKFWGAIASLLKVPSVDDQLDAEAAHRQKGDRRRAKAEEADMYDFREELESLLETTRPFKDLLSQTPSDQKAKITIPDDFYKAWVHVLMCAIFVAQHSTNWKFHFDKAAKLIDRGMKAIMEGLKQKDLLRDSVVMPQEVASLINIQLLRDGIHSDTHRDIAHVYSDYFSLMRSEIEANPLDRTHQDRILRFEQEIQAIVRILESQRQIVLGMNGRVEDTNRERSRSGYVEPKIKSYSRARESYRRKSDYYQEPVTTGRVELVITEPTGQSRLTAIDPGGYRELLTNEALALIGRKLTSFDELLGDAGELRRMNIRRIETNKDRQESAIYIFTVVTVIFLPLSTVAGILGMNTNDIRNMEVNQWVFWVVAIPLTAIIIFLCLAGTGILNSVRKGLYAFAERRSDRNRSRSRYYDDDDYYYASDSSSERNSRRRRSR